MIQLIEGHKQRTHLAIQPLQQEAAHIFRHLEAAQSGAQLQRLQFVFIRQRLQLDLPQSSREARSGRPRFSCRGGRSPVISSRVLPDSGIRL